MAQLEERWSHNPKVVSSILTSRILFIFIKMSEEGKRELGTVILTSSVTKGEQKVGKILPDGNSIECEETTYNRYDSMSLSYIV